MIGALLGLLGYLAGSGELLLNGALRLWYCHAPFARKLPTWGLPLDSVPTVEAAARSGILFHDPGACMYVT